MSVSSSIPALLPDLDARITSNSTKAANNTNARSSAVLSKATEFEAILLGQWLQGSETAFGSVPGGDDDEDAGADQMKSFAFQHLASGLAEKGGVGIAMMVSSALSIENKAAASLRPTHASVDVQQLKATSGNTGPGTEPQECFQLRGGQ